MFLKFTQPILHMRNINVTDLSGAQQLINNIGTTGDFSHAKLKMLCSVQLLPIALELSKVFYCAVQMFKC